MAQERDITPMEIVDQATRNVRAGPAIRRMQGLYPQIHEPIRAVVPLVQARLGDEGSVQALSAGVQAMARHWDADLDRWREGQVDNHELLREVLARCYQPLLKALARAGQIDETLPEQLPELAEPIAQHREGEACWRVLRRRALNELGAGSGGSAGTGDDGG